LGATGEAKLIRAFHQEPFAKDDQNKLIKDFLRIRQHYYCIILKE
jgi:hypothetical protein